MRSLKSLFRKKSFIKGKFMRLKQSLEKICNDEKLLK